MENDNILKMFNEEGEDKSNTKVLDAALKKQFQNEKYILCFFNSKGYLRLHMGDGLTLAEMLMLQKALNLKLDEEAKKDFYGPGPSY